jgi:MSHA biogenesis protein MshJ
MIRQYWDKLNATVNALSLRERALIFAAAAFLLVSALNILLLDPLAAQQRRMSSQLVQQQEQIKEIDAQIEALLHAKRTRETSPQHRRLDQLRKQLAEGEAYIRARQDRMVPAERIHDLLEQVLKKNGRLELVQLQTLPVTSFIEKSGAMPGNDPNAALPPESVGKQIFKHGVQLTVRGNYADMVDYLDDLEHLPAQMLWGMAKMNVIKYPTAELTLTVYTLSLEKTWLRI